MFSVITNTYNKKTKGPALMELFTATAIAAAKNIDAPMLTFVCQELEYLIDVCLVTVVHVYNTSSCHKKNFFSFLVAVNSSIKVGRIVFLL
jgi:hypothetical protein